MDLKKQGRKTRKKRKPGAKRRPLFYRDETFKANFWIYYGWDPLRVTKHLKIFFDEGADSLNLHEGLAGKMCHFTNGAMEVIVIWTRHFDPSVLAHECVHAATIVLETRGVKSNDEPLAYLVESLVRNACQQK